MGETVTTTTTAEIATEVTEKTTQGFAKFINIVETFFGTDIAVLVPLVVIGLMVLAGVVSGYKILPATQPKITHVEKYFPNYINLCHLDDEKMANLGNGNKLFEWMKKRKNIKENRKKIEAHELYFYFRKATAYRMLFEMHTGLGNVMAIFNITMSAIIMYSTQLEDGSGWTMFFSMISAIGIAVEGKIPFNEYAKTYVSAARIMENAINGYMSSEKDEKDEKDIGGTTTEKEGIGQKFSQAYKEAEKVISEGFM